MRGIFSGSLFAVVWLVVLNAFAAEESAGDVIRPLEVKTYRGWQESLILNAGRVRLVVTPAVGGRVTFYGFNGENILFENPASFGKTTDTTKEDFWMGGYQCDLGPELRGIPDHVQLWKGKYEWMARRHAVKVVSPNDTNLGIQMEKEIFIAPDSGDAGITQRMINTSERDVTFCLWDRTLCVGGGFALLPLNRKSRFKAGWSLHKTVEGKDTYDGATPASPKVQVLNGVLVVKMEGAATKVGADSDAGWVAYVKGLLMFVKYFPYSPKGNYSDGGNSVELYFNEQIAELEPLSPEITLKPREKYEFPEKWTLIELNEEVLTHAQARELVKLIPPSPFAR